MTRVYTAFQYDRPYHGKTLLELSMEGLPVGGYGTTDPRIAQYYAGRSIGNWAIIALDIPNLKKYIRVTDKYKDGNISFEIIKKPKIQHFVKLGNDASDFI